ncbi:uncharacterized mitochondrial protein AtMg01250-like [Vicia villosa]|uniref:uncharacterized mitochondrial protein AtMg01250-like n=1 Tax=Vicia villosa TaxID=3911 RepID=UPI00273C0836|nr:uncharacterized mitochondrial protein AtMg01250-like [Vicia villosa]
MGFGERWLKWMEATVFTSTMAVLVNGSTTADFQVSRGLRQGDPLSPFLFTIVADGLVGMMKQAVSGGLYRSFKLTSTVEYNLLQFADDTILFGDGSWSNLWTLKALLKGFKMASGLRINLHKSKLYAVCSSAYKVEASATFLGCKIDRLPFKFLGIWVGGNHRNSIF